MRLEIPVRKIIYVSVIIVSLLFGIITGSEDFMKRLPVYEQLRCEICHTAADPVVGFAELNNFGVDFKSNNFIWDQALADIDSDMDGFKNGVELGDIDGDGTSTLDFVRSNPGNPDDKPSSINQQTWGVLKNLFVDK